MKGSDILKQEITSHDEAVALMQQGSILMVVGWWAKAKAIEYLVNESGLSFNKWHKENCMEFHSLGATATELQRQQAWKVVKFLDLNGVDEDILPKIENHAYRLRKVDEADKITVWTSFVNSDDKVPQWDKKPTRPKWDPDRDWDAEFADANVKTNKDELMALSKYLIDDNQAELMFLIGKYMHGYTTKIGAARKALKRLNDLYNEK